MIITPSKIRIGNKLLINGLHGQNVIMTISSITGKGSLSDQKRVLFFEEDNEQVGEFLMHCAGIPITEEMLLSFGFYLEYKSDFTIKYSLPDATIGYDWGKMDGWGLRYFGHKIKCEYVHLLQNICLDLTGSDLIKATALKSKFL